MTHQAPDAHAVSLDLTWLRLTLLLGFFSFFFALRTFPPCKCLQLIIVMLENQGNVQLVNVPVSVPSQKIINISPKLVRVAKEPQVGLFLFSLFIYIYFFPASFPRSMSIFTLFLLPRRSTPYLHCTYTHFVDCWSSPLFCIRQSKSGVQYCPILFAEGITTTQRTFLCQHSDDFPVALSSQNHP